MKFRFNLKNQLILYLFALAIFIILKDKNTPFLFAVFVSVLSSVFIESLILFLKEKRFKINDSSIITGLIIGYVIASDEALWKIVFISLFAILSKYLIRFRNKHIFNPAGFGLFLGTIFLSVSLEWQGTYLWYILIPFGLYFVYRIKRIFILLGYIGVSLVLFFIKAVLNNYSLVGFLYYFSYFYIFVMLIEPKTTPTKTLPQLIFGALVATLAFMLTEIGVRFDVEIFSLLVLNISVPLLNLLLEKKEV